MIDERAELVLSEKDALRPALESREEKELDLKMTVVPSSASRKYPRECG